ncbi:TonB family protein [Aromatoleum diolicum]|uniref:TonB family protein n=2 Tax=Aromatoleum diolicum TaxID=75796 RepID=A0ABX1Q9H2_9RHOO|nr:TonB family protein [Aromatoleum diolicum]
MVLSHALPVDPFTAPPTTDGRRSLSFAPPLDAAFTGVQRRARPRAGGARERRLTLALVVVAHVAALIGISRLAQQPAAAPETPISVALIELPVPIPPVAVTVAPPPTPPAPKPVVKPQPRPKVRTAQPPAPVPVPMVESASAISTDATPQPPQEAPREAPPPATAPVRPAPEAPPPIVAARFDAAYLNNPAPAYPPLARRMREEGKVMLRVQVTAEGLPGKVELAESSGVSRLDNAARESVLRWRFVPAKQDGRAVDASVIVPIVFKLEGN